jgi:hypothetical protein
LPINEQTAIGYDRDFLESNAFGIRKDIKCIFARENFCAAGYKACGPERPGFIEERKDPVMFDPFRPLLPDTAHLTGKIAGRCKKDDNIIKGSLKCCSVKGLFAI